MSKLPGWLGRLGAGLSEVGARLEERRAEGEREVDEDVAAASPDPSAQAAVADQVPRP
ncbi:MAG TPA: AI-2E family transporter, partial [Streptomyces sp.]|nr:AI-2E family transporter [Streptomyces sp.]